MVVKFKPPPPGRAPGPPSRPAGSEAVEAVAAPGPESGASRRESIEQAAAPAVAAAAVVAPQQPAQPAQPQAPIAPWLLQQLPPVGYMPAPIGWPGQQLGMLQPMPQQYLAAAAGLPTLAAAPSALSLWMVPPPQQQPLPMVAASLPPWMLPQQQQQQWAPQPRMAAAAAYEAMGPGPSLLLPPLGVRPAPPVVPVFETHGVLSCDRESR